MLLLMMKIYRGTLLEVHIEQKKRKWMPVVDGKLNTETKPELIDVNYSYTPVNLCYIVNMIYL